jgi:hypothetical protein
MQYEGDAVLDRFSGAGAADPFVATALRFLDRTEPMLGAGAGVAFTGGPVTLDLGYRYKRILPERTAVWPL